MDRKRQLYGHQLGPFSAFIPCNCNNIRPGCVTFSREIFFEKKVKNPQVYVTIRCNDCGKSNTARFDRVSFFRFCNLI